jgi:hypothetical protein
MTFHQAKINRFNDDDNLFQFELLKEQKWSAVQWVKTVSGQLSETDPGSTRSSPCHHQLMPLSGLIIWIILQRRLSVFRKRWTPLTNKFSPVLDGELVGFDLIPVGVRLKWLQVGIKTKTSADAKDIAFGIDEPLNTEMVLQIPQIIFTQPDWIWTVPHLIYPTTWAKLLSSENANPLINTKHGFYDLVVIWVTLMIFLVRASLPIINWRRKT